MVWKRSRPSGKRNLDLSSAPHADRRVLLIYCDEAGIQDGQRTRLKLTMAANRPEIESQTRPSIRSFRTHVGVVL